MILHIHKRDCPYVQIDKRPLEDERLSWKAKGILAYLLSKPPGWEVRREDIENHGTDGREAVQSGLADLAAHGYASLENIQDPTSGRLIGKRWIVAESPELLAELLGKPHERESRLSDTGSAGEPTNGKPVKRVDGPYSKTENTSNTNLSVASDVVEDGRQIDPKTHDKTSPPLFPELEPEHPDAAHAAAVVKHVAETSPEIELNTRAARIYEEYPKKVGKLAGLREIKRALKKHPYTFLLTKTKHYAICRMGKDPQYTMAPERFFKDGHFMDDEGEWTTSRTAKFQRENAAQSNFPPSGKPQGVPALSGEERRKQRQRLAQEQAEFSPTH
jgi:hypothetical protein